MKRWSTLSQLRAKWYWNNWQDSINKMEKDIID